MKPELNEIAVLNCDLSSLPLSDFEEKENTQTRKRYYVAHLLCKMIVAGTCLEVHIIMDGKILCQTKIEDIQIEVSTSTG
jgi:hypothetical protein